MKRVGNIHIGTSGWHYMHWKGSFYPEGMTAPGFLSFYSERFHTVEINNSFYRLPKAESFDQWRENSPPGFIFSVKANRYITHMKKLKDPHDTLPPLLERSGLLREKLGPFLFQLPPRWRFNKERFHAFLAVLPARFRYAFEFRNPTWLNRDAYEIMQKNRVAFCIFELAGFISPKEVTADFVYVRLHGPGDAYQGQYDDKVLAGWAEAFTSWSSQEKEIFCYFDNDQAGYAAQNALRLQKLISGG